MGTSNQGPVLPKRLEFGASPGNLPELSSGLSLFSRPPGSRFMEFILLFFVFFVTSTHLRGFSHTLRPGWKEVFFFNESPGEHLFVDDFFTGIQGSGFLYFPPETQAIRVQYFKGAHLQRETHLSLQHAKTIIHIPAKACWSSVSYVDFSH